MCYTKRVFKKIQILTLKVKNKIGLPFNNNYSVIMLIPAKEAFKSEMTITLA